MKYIPFPDSYIHPRSNQPAKGHAGRMAEIKFFHIFKYTVDDEVRWATKKENIYKKYDVVSSYKQYGKMDVKAEKDALDFGTIWIEYQNGDGYPGWIYGEAKYIVFDLYSKFIFVDREYLLQRANNLTKGSVYIGDQEPFNNYVYKSQALYKPYRRDGRLDILTKIKTDDIMDLYSHELQIPEQFHSDLYRTNK
tara:strand:- start:21 stop:602 length:582 start_codon:yes stop_codon:yes gene_type:complete